MLFCVTYGCGRRRFYHYATSIHQAPNQDKQCGIQKGQGNTYVATSWGKHLAKRLNLSFYFTPSWLKPFTTAVVIASRQLWCHLRVDDSYLEQDLLYNSNFRRKWIIYWISLLDCHFRCSCNNSALLIPWQKRIIAQNAWTSFIIHNRLSDNRWSGKFECLRAKWPE